MIELDTDIAIIGGGFSGSLLAMLLKQIGMSSVVIDRGVHPRFAIGESTTPICNLVLEGLTRRYGLDRLTPLASYGSWKRTYPQVVCGLKRGFSYFHHPWGQDFKPRSDHANELLVAASAGSEDADTHWLRSDFDQFLYNEAEAMGIPCFDQTTLEHLHSTNHGWRLEGHRFEEGFQCSARFVIDASGDGGFVGKQLGVGNHPSGLRTRSRGLFSHFRNVRRWNDLFTARGGNSADHPYPCDDAALHHVFDGGWMWVLPFDNGITSAGFSLDPGRFPLDRAVSPEAEWAAIMENLPAVKEQFAVAEPTVPWRQTGRMQRRWARSTGANWAMLSNTAAFHDPLHSTGNAFTLVGIERLLEILERSWKRPELAEELRRHDELVQQEAEFIDLVVSGSFTGFREFERMVALSMFYFSAAIWSEIERRSGQARRGAAFLSADHPELKSALVRAAAEISDAGVSTADFVDRIRHAIAPFNRVGLGDPAKRNQYAFECGE